MPLPGGMILPVDYLIESGQLARFADVKTSAQSDRDTGAGWWRMAKAAGVFAGWRYPCRCPVAAGVPASLAGFFALRCRGGSRKRAADGARGALQLVTERLRKWGVLLFVAL